MLCHVTHKGRYAHGCLGTRPESTVLAILLILCKHSGCPADVTRPPSRHHWLHLAAFALGPSLPKAPSCALRQCPTVRTNTRLLLCVEQGKGHWHLRCKWLQHSPCRRYSGLESHCPQESGLRCAALPWRKLMRLRCLRPNSPYAYQRIKVLIACTDHTAALVKMPCLS